MKALIHFLLIFLGIPILYAQEISIAGRLIDQSTERPIPHASVSLLDHTGQVVAFKSSEKDGTFSIKIPGPLPQLKLSINHLGFEKKEIDVLIPFPLTSILLQPKTHRLQDVQVKSKPKITQLGDTISYAVQGFAAEEDRSIGDVLKKMPGIEVSESGQIKYQGKSISNFYIDGDDLLDDRYAIGTRTIPHHMVKDIQILNNHEHLKVLKNKRFTDQVAINLVIKEDAKLKLTGQAKVGLGMPELYDSELNTILFNKKVKMLNVLEANNTGKDLSRDFIGFNQASLLSQMGSSPINNLLSLGMVSPPPLNQKLYLRNHTAAINTNKLLNFKNDLQFKSNIQALYDNNERHYAGQTIYYTEGSEVNFNERQDLEAEKFMGAIRLTATKNQTSKYLNNTFSFEYENEHAYAKLHANEALINQFRTHRISGLSNTFNFVPELKNKQLIEVNWYFTYGNKPQTLGISPGIFPQLLNQDIPYLQTQQQVSVPSSFSNLHFIYRMPNRKIKQAYEIGMIYEKQQLNSEIQVQQSNLLMETLAFQNNMHWKRSRYYGKLQYEYHKNGFESSWGLPWSYQRTQFEDPSHQLDESRNDWLFNPQIKTKYRINHTHELSLQYQYSNTFGNLENVYRGLIIKNYRSLSRNTSDINESNIHTASLDYNYSKIVQFLFANSGISFSQKTSNNMLSTRVDNQITEEFLVPFSHTITSWSGYMGIDKYIYELASTFKLKTSYAITNYNQLFNELLLPYQHINYSIQPALEAKIWKGYNLSYQSQINWISNRQKYSDSSTDLRTFSINQFVHIPIINYRNMHINLKIRHLYSRQAEMNAINYMFYDVFARYRIKKWKTDLEFDLSNLSNIKKFSTYHSSANMLSYNQYELRGRMLSLKAIFNL